MPWKISWLGLLNTFQLMLVNCGCAVQLLLMGGPLLSVLNGEQSAEWRLGAARSGGSTREEHFSPANHAASVIALAVRIGDPLRDHQRQTLPPLLTSTWKCLNSPPPTVWPQTPPRWSVGSACVQSRVEGKALEVLLLLEAGKWEFVSACVGLVLRPLPQ